MTGFVPVSLFFAVAKKVLGRATALCGENPICNFVAWDSGKGKLVSRTSTHFMTSEPDFAYAFGPSTQLHFPRDPSNDDG